MDFTKFEYTSYPRKIFFGENSFQMVGGILSSYKKAFVIAGDRQRVAVQMLIESLGSDRVSHFSTVIQHVPVVLVEKAKAQLEAAGTDVIVAIGGGSAIGLAKALALQTKQHIVAVPTTFAGSEMTNIYGLTTAEGKTTGRDPVVLPRYVIYDPSFTAAMPLSLAATSAMNAMAHLMEALYAPDANPITNNDSLEGMKKLMQGMSKIAGTTQLSKEANQLLQYGSMLAGKALCEVSMSLHHKLAHVLGGTFGLDHASVHTVLQAYVLEYQWPALSDELQNDFSEVLNHPYPPDALLQLAKTMGAPTALRKIGFQEQDIESAVDLVLAKPYANPRPLTRQGLIAMLHNAFDGTLAGRP